MLHNCNILARPGYLQLYSIRCISLLQFLRMMTNLKIKAFFSCKFLFSDSMVETSHAQNAKDLVIDFIGGVNGQLSFCSSRTKLTFIRLGQTRFTCDVKPLEYLLRLFVSIHFRASLRTVKDSYLTL